jgi:hypothetical protein
MGMETVNDVHSSSAQPIVEGKHRQSPHHYHASSTLLFIYLRFNYRLSTMIVCWMCSESTKYFETEEMLKVLKKQHSNGLKLLQQS